MPDHGQLRATEGGRHSGGVRILAFESNPGEATEYARFDKL
jgi:hypothetical protein